MIAQTEIRQFAPADFPAVEAPVAASGSLHQHTPYTYWTAHRLFPALFLVAETDGDMSGFVFGAGPNGAGEVLCWQIASAEAHRGSGLGRELLRAFIDRARTAGARTLLFTVEEDNHASRRLFESCARQVGAPLRDLGLVPRLSAGLKPEQVLAFQI